MGGIAPLNPEYSEATTLVSALPLPTLRSSEDVGVEQKHQEKSAGRKERWTWRLKLNVREAWHEAGLHDVPPLAGEALVLLDAEQHMGRLALVDDEYRPLGRGFFGQLVSWLNSRLERVVITMARLRTRTVQWIRFALGVPR